MYSHDNVITKLTQLTELVNVSESDELNEDKDLIWCKRLLGDVKDSGLVPDRIEFNMANLMWKKYATSGVKSDDNTIWELIDSLLTQENPTKIGAIKMYRRFIKNVTLREAKEVIDAREIKIKKGW